MCKQSPLSVISTCSSCAAAPKRKRANFGSVIGTQDLIHTTDCTWESANFNVTYTYPGPGGSDVGQYKATHTEAGSSSTCVITYVSGTDCLKIGSGYRALSWKADPDKEWSCSCNNTMIPSVPASRFPPSIYTICELCMTPVDDAGSDWIACHVDAGCVSQLILPTNGLIDIADSANPELWTMQIAQVVAGSCCYVSVDGTETSSSGLEYNFLNGDPSMYWRGSVCITEDESHNWILTVFITIIYGTPDVIIGQHSVTYSVNVSSLVVGVNSITFVSQSDSGSGGTATWPGSYDLVVDDCTFGANNYDYGYGCGYDAGGNPQPPTCSGGCIWRGADKNGAIGGFGGAPYQWVQSSSGTDAFCSDGCSCDTPGADPTSSHDFTTVSCS